MALLDGEVYEEYRHDLLNKYRLLLRTLSGKIAKDKRNLFVKPLIMPQGPTKEPLEKAVSLIFFIH